MALPKKPAKPSQTPAGPPKPARKREEDELARKKKKVEDDEDEDEDEDEGDDDEAEDDEDTLEADEDEEGDDEEVDEEELDEEELDEEDLDEEDLDEEDLDDEDLDDEDLDDDEDFDDDEDDEDDDEDDDDDDDDEDDDEDDDDDEEDEDESPKRRKTKKSRGEAGATTGDGAKVAVAAAGVAAGALAATAIAKKTSGINSKVGDTAKKTSGIVPKVDDASAKKMSGVNKKVEAKEEGEVTASGATKTGIKPMSKKGPVMTANKSGRIPGASSATGTSSRRQAGAATPPKKDKFKTIALVACALLFLACVGVGGYILFLKPGKTKREVLSPEAAALIKKADAAEADYAIAQEKMGSEKVEDLIVARDKMLHAVELWNEILESRQMVPGAEEKINNARRMAETADKQAHDLSEKVTKLEMEKRIQDSKNRTKNNTPTTTPTVTNNTPPTKSGDVETIDEAEFQKMKDGDPSEYERIEKALKNGKAKFKGKDDAPKEPAPAPADAPKAGAVELIDEAAFKKMEQDDPSEYERIQKALKTGKAKFKGKEGDAPAPADKPAEKPPEKKNDADKLPDKAPDKPAE